MKDKRKYWGGLVSLRMRRKKYRYKWQLNRKQLNIASAILKGLGR